jgi:hypothetical protein
LRKLRFLAQGGTRYSQVFYPESFKAAVVGGNGVSDISDHLRTI